MKYITTYTGLRVGLDPTSTSVPSVRDIAVALGRICRFAGNGISFYPVLLHSMIVADLLPEELQAYGLLHDAAESVISDIPRPFKGPDMQAIELTIYHRILLDQRVPEPGQSIQMLVKAADQEALVGEVYTVGPPAMCYEFPERCRYAEELVLDYTRRFPPATCIHPDGTAVIEFTRRVHEAKEIMAARKLTVQ